MMYIFFFLGILLVPLRGLDGARGPCPFPCRCTLEILNCSRINNTPGIHQIPLPKPGVHPHRFKYLDFTGNAISSIGKEVWKAYPWAEYLILKDNSLNRLQNSSLEGLFSLTYLDLSCNKIQIIDKNAFEAVPFLQIINLSGNIIERVTEGTFQAWHGMQFLSKVDLSHNPLAVIQDSYFYRLPSLKFLDLGATEVMPKTLEDLLQTSLNTLILPKKMSCCLCHIKEDIEILCKTIKLECTESCDINATLCEKEESLNSIQGEVMKILEIRKLNGSNLLTILPEGRNKNVSNITTASSRNMEQPLDTTEHQRNPEQEFRKKILLALSQAVIVTVIVGVTFLFEICSRCSADKDRTFLGRRKEPRTDEELGSPLVENPPSLKGQPLDERQKKMVDKLQYEDSSGAEEIYGWGGRPSSSANTPEKPSSVPTLELLILPIPPPPLPSF